MMRIPLVIFSIYLFPLSLQGQEHLNLEKSITWEGFEMEGAKGSQDDSSIFKCTRNSIFMENLYSGESRELLHSDTRILNFDIDENKKHICFINEKSELIVYNYNNKNRVANRILDPANDLTIPIFSPSGNRILLSRHKAYGTLPTDQL